MFGNNDFNKKKDPLVDAVAKVMQENQLRRDIEKRFQEEIGIQAKRELPFQQHAEYDRVLSERTVIALNEGSMKKEELVGNQHKIDANKNNKVDAQDFKLLKAKKAMNEDDLEKFEPDDKKPEKKQKVSLYKHKTSGKEISSVKNPGDNWELVNEAEYPPGAGQDTAKDKDPDMMKGRPGEKDETPRAAPMPPKRPANMEEEALDELSKKTLGSYVKKASHDVATKSAATGRYAERANKVKDETKKGDYSNYQQGKKDDATADKMFNKSWKRRAGIAKAVDKLTKEETLAEKAPSGDKYERMVKHIKDKYSKGGLTDKEKSIAYATAQKAKNKDSE